MRLPQDSLASVGYRLVEFCLITQPTPLPLLPPILLPLFKAPGSNFPWVDGENCDTMLDQQ